MCRHRYPGAPTERCPSGLRSAIGNRVGGVNPPRGFESHPLRSGPPTVDESGLPGLYFSPWYALFAPKSTAKIITDKLNTAITEVLADPAVRSRLEDLTQEIYPRDQQTPEALAALQKAEIEKWWPIIKAANIKGE